MTILIIGLLIMQFANSLQRFKFSFDEHGHNLQVLVFILRLGYALRVNKHPIHFRINLLLGYLVFVDWYILVLFTPPPLCAAKVSCQTSALLVVLSPRARSPPFFAVDCFDFFHRSLPSTALVSSRLSDW